jgi:hypothetical protein
MPAHARVNGGDSHAAGRGRQRLKLGAIGYAHSRHGIDTNDDKIRAAVAFLCQMAIEFVAALPGTYLKNRRLDLYAQGDSEMLQLAAIAYAAARHGVDADVGMAREGLAILCQAAIDFVESLPKEDQAKRATDPHLQIGGA